MRLLCLLLLTAFSASALAQLHRGDALFAAGETPGFRVPLPVAAPAAPLSLYHDGAYDRTHFRGGATYGVAVLDRLLVGGTVGLDVLFGEYARRTVTLAPLVRYYAVNRAALRAYGQLQSGVRLSSLESAYFRTATIAAGVQLPLGGGALVGPQVAYTVQEGSNLLAAGVHLELQLAAATDEASVGVELDRGRYMLGIGTAGISVTENVKGANVRAGAHYFVTDRLAAAAVIGYDRSNESYDFGNGQERYVRFRTLHLGGGLRAYLADTGRLLWYGEAGAGRVWESLETNTGIDYFPGGFTYATAGVGGQYFLTPHVAVEAGPQLRYDLTNEAWVVGMNVGIRFLR